MESYIKEPNIMLSNYSYLINANAQAMVPKSARNYTLPFLPCYQLYTKRTT